MLNYSRDDAGKSSWNQVLACNSAINNCWKRKYDESSVMNIGEALKSGSKDDAAPLPFTGDGTGL
jgi:hypothetical protein